MDGGRLLLGAQFLAGVLPEKADISAHRDRADAIVRIPLSETEDAWTHPEGEYEDLHPEQLGHDEVSALVHENEDADQDEEEENSR